MLFRGLPRFRAKRPVPVIDRPLINRDRVTRFIASAYELALSRSPTADEAAALIHAFDSGDKDLLDLFESIRMLACSGAYDYRSDPDLSQYVSRELLDLSRTLSTADLLSRVTYDQLYGERFNSGRDLIIGQAEYGLQHKERFWEMFNAAAYLLRDRPAPRVLEFGTSEFSGFFSVIIPGVQIHVSDRPTSPGYIGFTEAVARRVTGCAVYAAIDLEDGAPAILGSGLDTGSYDFVVFTEVLEHLDVNPVELLEALLVLLKRDGFLYLTTPNFFRRENREKFYRFENPQQVYPIGQGNWDRHHHHREYGFKELFRFIEAAGGQTVAFYFSSCWDVEPLPPEHERGNLVFVVRRR